MYRQVAEKLSKLIKQNRSPIILIFGPRQVGKSTLAESLGSEIGYVRFNFDLLADQQEFTSQDRHSLILFSEKYKGKLVIIDEIQKRPEATAVVKHLYDTYGMKFILTGSSEIKIRKGMGDSLVGRIHEVRLYPLSLKEIDIQSGLEFDADLEFVNYEENQGNLLKYLVYGSLPQLQNISLDQYENYLKDFVNTLIAKDVLEISGTRKSTQVYSLAKMLAMQIGQLVNFNELANNTELSRESVYRYIDIFEQIGLVVKAKPISTNERESISKATKIYFVDLGLRNALVGNFDSWGNRLDKGQLLENAVFLGLKRQNDYSDKTIDLGFFRSEYGSEIDIVEKQGDSQRLFEVKVNHKMATKTKKSVEYITLANAQKFLY